MGEAGDLEEVGEVLRLGVEEDLLKEAGAELGDAEGGELTVSDICGGDAEGLCGGEDLVDGLIVHLDVEDAGIRVLFKHFVLGGNIVSELVKLQ